jgi:hypothetical protein
MYGSHNLLLYFQDPAAINEHPATRDESITVLHRAKHDNASTAYSARDSHRQIPSSAVDLG